MADAALGWALAATWLLGLVVLVAVAVRQVVQRYSPDKPLMAAWVAVVVLYPVGGAAAWFLWESWLRDVVRGWRDVAHS